MCDIFVRAGKLAEAFMDFIKKCCEWTGYSPGLQAGPTHDTGPGEFSSGCCFQGSTHSKRNPLPTEFELPRPRASNRGGVLVC